MALDEYDILADILTPSTIAVESGGDPNAVSPKGARGLMQVMPTTARDPGYGVTPSNGTQEDDVRTGRDYLAAMLRKYKGDISTARAAYNAGPGRVDRGGPLPQETVNYVAKANAQTDPAVLGTIQGNYDGGGDTTAPPAARGPKIIGGPKGRVVDPLEELDRQIAEADGVLASKADEARRTGADQIVTDDAIRDADAELRRRGVNPETGAKDGYFGGGLEGGSRPRVETQDPFDADRLLREGQQRNQRSKQIGLPVGEDVNFGTVGDRYDDLSLGDKLANAASRGVSNAQGQLAAMGASGATGTIGLFDQIDRAESDGDRQNLMQLRMKASSNPFAFQYINADADGRAALRDKFRTNRDENIGDLVQSQKDAASTPTNPRFSDAAAKGEWLRAMGVFLKEPSMIFQVGLESAPSMAPGIAASLVTGNPIVGMGLGSLATDYAASLVDAMSDSFKEAGVEFTADAVKAALSDPMKAEELRNRAALHAIPVAFFDAWSGGLVRKTFAPSNMLGKALSPVQRQAINLPAQGVVQGAMGAAGEASGEVLSGQKLDPAQIIPEFFGEFATAPIEVASLGKEGIMDRLHGRTAQPNVAAPIAPAPDLAAIAPTAMQPGAPVAPQAAPGTPPIAPAAPQVAPAPDAAAAPPISPAAQQFERSTVQAAGGVPQPLYGDAWDSHQIAVLAPGELTEAEATTIADAWNQERARRGGQPAPVAAAPVAPDPATVAPQPEAVAPAPAAGAAPGAIDANALRTMAAQLGIPTNRLDEIAQSVEGAPRDATFDTLTPDQQFEAKALIEGATDHWRGTPTQQPNQIEVIDNELAAVDQALAARGEAPQAQAAAAPVEAQPAAVAPSPVADDLGTTSPLPAPEPTAAGTPNLIPDDELARLGVPEAVRPLMQKGVEAKRAYNEAVRTGTDQRATRRAGNDVAGARGAFIEAAATAGIDPADADFMFASAMRDDAKRHAAQSAPQPHEQIAAIDQELQAIDAHEKAPVEAVKSDAPASEVTPAAPQEIALTPEQNGEIGGLRKLMDDTRKNTGRPYENPEQMPLFMQARRRAKALAEKFGTDEPAIWRLVEQAQPQEEAAPEAAPATLAPRAPEKIVSAYGEDDAVNAVMADPELRHVAKAMTKAAESWAQMREAAHTGKIPADADVTPQLVEALGIIRQAKDAGKPVRALLDSPDFTGDVSDATKAILRFFYRGRNLEGRPRSADSVAEALRDVANRLRKIGPDEKPNEVVDAASSKQESNAPDFQAPAEPEGGRAVGADDSNRGEEGRGPGGPARGEDGRVGVREPAGPQADTRADAGREAGVGRRAAAATVSETPPSSPVPHTVEDFRALNPREQKRLRHLRDRDANGELTATQGREMDRLSRRSDNVGVEDTKPSGYQVAADKSDTGDVRRGPNAIVDRLRFEMNKDSRFNEKARADGKPGKAALDPDDVREIEAFLRFLGDKLTATTGLSIRRGDATTGLGRSVFEPDMGASVVMLFRKAIEEGHALHTVVHEFWHTIEPYLNDQQRAGLWKEWRRAVARYTAKNHWYIAFHEANQDRGERTLRGADAVKFAERWPEALTRDDIAVKRDDEGDIRSIELLVRPENYRLLDPSEWFAETLADRYQARDMSDPARTVMEHLRAIWDRMVVALRRITRVSPMTERIYEDVRAGRQDGNVRGALVAYENEKNLPASPPKKAAPAADTLGQDLSHPDRGAFSWMGDKGLSTLERLTRASTRRAIRADLDEARRVLQDRFIDVRRTQEEIQENTGKKLSPDEDPYLGEELYKGKVEERFLQLDRHFLEPLGNVLAKFDKLGKFKTARDALNAVDQWLYARHAPERNAAMQKINPSVATGSGMSNQKAANILEQADKAGWTPLLQQIAALHDALGQHVLDTRVELGLMSQQDAARVKQVYQHYTPLRGFSEVDPEAVVDVRRGSGKGFSVRGDEDRKALGRDSLADHPLATMVTMARDAIMRGEKNQVGQTLANLVRAYPSPDFWGVDKPSVRPKLNKSTGLVEMQAGPLTAEEEERTLRYKENGEEHRITLPPELAKPLKNLDATQVHWALRRLLAMGRWFSAINTRWNPEFALVNAIRDAGEATMNAQSYDTKELARKISPLNPKGHYWGAMRALMDGGVTDHTSNPNGEWQKWAKRWRQAGGKVAFFGLPDVQEVARDLATTIGKERQNIVVTPLRAAGEFFHRVGLVNEAIENATRLATFRAAVEAGMPDARAASMSKNITVNFNRHGSAGPITNSLYTFFNAAMQGTRTMARTISYAHKPGPIGRRVRMAMGGMILAGLAQSFGADWLSDKDDDGETFYDKLTRDPKGKSTWQARKNAILPWHKGALMLPLPPGFSVLYQFGRQMGDVMQGKTKVGPALADLFGTMADAYNPLGEANSGLNLVAPTVVDPAVDIARNRNFADKPIHPQETPWNKNDPAAYQAFKSTSLASQWAARQSNELTGGNRGKSGMGDFYPGDMDHILGTAVGAAGSFVTRNLDLIGKSAKGDKVQFSDLPFVRRFAWQKPDWLDSSRYYARQGEIAAAKHEIDIMRKAGRGAEVSDESKSLALLYGKTKSVDEQLKSIRALRRTIEADARIDDDEKKKRIEGLTARQNKVMTDFNRAYLTAQGGGK